MSTRRNTTWILLAGAIALTTWAYAPLLGLGFTGEDLVVFMRIEGRLDADSGLRRPLLDAWLGGLHALFGITTPLPYFAAALALHLACCALLFGALQHLAGNPWIAAAGAALFGIGAGCCDSLAWIAAVNRPLSALGALVVINGLVRLDARPRMAWALIIAGLAWQYTHAEVHGTALLVLAVALGRILQRRSPASALAGATIAVAVLITHFCWMRGSEGEGILGGSIERLIRLTVEGGWTRYRLLLEGWGTPTALAPWILVSACALLLLGPFRRACFAIAWTLTSLVPYAITDPLQSYRNYPSHAPLAALGVLALCGVLLRLRARDPGDRAIPLASLLLVGAVAIGSHHPRTTRLERWRSATEEIAACQQPVREFAEQFPGAELTPINLFPSTLPLFEYHGLRPRPTLSFLDTPTGFVAPPLPAPPLLGRRGDGSHGRIDLQALFASERPRIEAYRLYGALRPSDGLATSRALLDSGEVDLRVEAVLEAPAEALRALEADGGSAHSQMEVLAPFTPSVDPEDFANSHATCRVRVNGSRPALLAIQPWMIYWDWFALPPDYVLINGIEEPRALLPVCVIEGSREELPCYFVNAMGTAVVVPPGDHILNFRWTLRSVASAQGR